MALVERLPTDEIESSETIVATNFLTSTIRSLFFSASSVGKESDNDKKLKHISLAEVLDHDSYDDCWVIIYDRVYDITSFLHQVSYQRDLHN
jgi:cytochrome b involved in lipid metabolism